MLSYLRNRFMWYNFPRMHRVSEFPGHMDVEISAICNMQCPMCFTTTEQFKKSVDKGLMKFDLFKKIVDEAAIYKGYSIRISHRGEPFVHPEVIDFITYAKNTGIKEVASLSNVLALTPDLFEKAMKAGLDWLTISVDGMGETYEWIRKPAKFDQTVERIKEYSAIKKRAHSKKPVIKIQSIWPAIKDYADEWVRFFEPFVDTLASNPLIDYLHNDEPDEIEFWPEFECPIPYQRMTILFNGLVPYCHNDEFITSILGDVNKDSIYDIWHSEEMNRVREAHRRHQGVKELTACKHCYLPRRSEPVVEYIGEQKIIVDKFTRRTEEIGK
jgi:MoaA/NifB/PqqE/SkfB family radical SAM enzyme